MSEASILAIKKLEENKCQKVVYEMSSEGKNSCPSYPGVKSALENPQIRKRMSEAFPNIERQNSFPKCQWPRILSRLIAHGQSEEPANHQNADHNLTRGRPACEKDYDYSLKGLYDVRPTFENHKFQLQGQVP